MGATGALQRKHDRHHAGAPCVGSCARNTECPWRRPMIGQPRQGQAPLEFWFDFASGYAYFAALEIEALAERHGRGVLWRPFTLGAAFKVTGAQGLSRPPLKREYEWRDWQRLARLKGVPFNLPADHPKVGLPAIRAFYAVDRKDTTAAARLAKHMILGYFQDGLDTDDPQAIARLASALGLDPDPVLTGITDPEVKAVARR